jgi:transcription elongation factor GreA-like protein
MYKMISMNKADKKNFKAVSRAIRSLGQGVYSSKELEEYVKQSGIEVGNMGSVLQAVVARTKYLQPLNNGNYKRVDKK